MTIKELYIKNFGKFSECSFHLQDGMNIFYGENEFGKSTLYSFIKGMLFGMERTRGRASKKDSFCMYEPWDNPNYYAGILRIESGGRTFRLERSFDKITKHAHFICEDDGEELSIEQGDLDILLDGMSESSFENTIAIGQLRVETTQSLAIELKNYAANYYKTGSSEIDVQHALEYLKRERKVVEQSIVAENLKKEQKHSRIEQEYTYIKRDYDKLLKERDEIRQKLSLLDREEQEQGCKKKSGENSFAFWMIALLFIVVIGMMVTFWIMDMTEIVKIIFAGLLVLGGIGAITWYSCREKQCRKNNVIQTNDSSRQSIEKLKWEENRVYESLHEKEIQLYNLKEQLEESEMDRFLITKLEKKCQALNLAQETIERLSKEIVKGFGASLNRRISEILSFITNGKYTKVFVDEKLSIFVLTKERKIPIQQLSRGTIEQIYFALRMAVLDTMYEEEFPVILDDTFVFYDDVRLEAVLKWLSQQKRQIILFTCQKREVKILRKLGIPFGINV